MIKEFLENFKDSYFICFHDSDSSQLPVDLKQQFDINKLYDLNTNGYGVYFSFNRFPGKRRISDCAGINAWAIDIDNKDCPKHIQQLRLQKSPLPPSFIVESKNGFHAYWLADNGTTELYSEIILRLIDWFDGDQNAKDITRVLRVPGFFHLKNPNEPFKIKLISDEGYTYTEEQMLKAFTKPRKKVEKNIWESLTSLNNEEVLNKLSGSLHVNGEQFTFRSNSNGTKQIIVNGKSTSCWIDGAGMIGSSDNGGPTWIQWLQWYGHSKSKIAEIAKEFGFISETSYEPKDYLKSDDGPYETFTPDGDEKNFHIYEHNSCYYLKQFNRKGELTVPKKLTNFILKPVNIFKDLSEHTYIREYKLINEDGEVKGPFKFLPDHYCTLSEFKKFTMARGNFVTFITDVLYNKLVEYLFHQSQGFKEVNLISKVGYIGRFNIWMFGNFAIKNGKIYRVDDNGIIWIGEQGFQANIYGGDDEEITSQPLTVDLDVKIDVANLQSQFIEMLCQSYGNHGVKIFIGWLRANVYSFDLMKVNKIFPLFWIYGKTRSGKDVLSTWGIQVFGLDSSIKESLPQMRSTVGITRKSGYYAYLPLPLDEYSNTDGMAKRFNGFFKNLATKTSVTKGTKRAKEYRQENIFSNFIFTSEQLPEEPALLNRAIVLRLNPYLRNDALYEKINEMSTDFFYIGIHWALRYQEDKNKFFYEYEKIKKELTSKGVSAHTADLYAVSGAGYKLCAPDDSQFDRELVTRCLEGHAEKEEQDKLNQFWTDLENVESFNLLPEIVAERDLKCEKYEDRDVIFFRHTYAFDAWMQYKIRQHGETSTTKAIRDLLKESPAYIEYNVQKKISGVNRRVFVLDYNLLEDQGKNFFDTYFEKHPEFDTKPIMQFA